MKITKSLIPKREEPPKKKQERTVSSNFDNSIKPENFILKKIIQKNSSLKNLKDKIQKESSHNMHEIFSSEESRLKAIKYVIHASKGKENQKNNINQNQNNSLKVKKNLSFIDIPISEIHKNKIKVNQKPIYTKIEEISPIKIEPNRNRFINDDKPLNKESLLRENNLVYNKKEKKYLYDSPSDLIPRNQSYEITSQREVNIQYLQPNNKNTFNNNNYNINSKTQNNFYNNNKNQFNEFNQIIKDNFYNKINYIKQKGRNKNPSSDFNYQSMYVTNDTAGNKTINNFYIHKKINKSTLDDNNQIKDNSINSNNNHQDIKLVNANQNNNNNHIGNNKINHKKNISQDGYFTNILIQKYDNKNPHYVTDTNNLYDQSKSHRLNYLNNLNQIKCPENNKKKKNIIRIMNNNNNNSNQIVQNLDTSLNNNNKNKQKVEKKPPVRKKNNSFFINDTIPITINQFNQKENNDKEYNNNILETASNNTYNNKLSLHRKFLTNIYYNGILTNNDNNNINYNDNKENISNNRIMVKKRPIKENNINYDLISLNSKVNQKNKYDKIFVNPNISFCYISKDKNKIKFNDENEIIDYIYNKFEEDKKINNDKKLKYTGFILTKKYKGKILHEIRIQDDINKLNQKIKEEKIQVGNDFIEIITSNHKDELHNSNNIISDLEKEISKLKQEIESMNKKDTLKNELIKKLEKEKQNIIEENEKFKKDLEQIKQLNYNLENQLKKISNQNNIENIIKTYKIENPLILNIENKPKINMLDINKLNEEKIENNQTSKNNENINNNVILNSNGRSEEGGLDSNKNNPLQRVSNIKEVEMMNGDSEDNQIKTNLNENKNNVEVNSFKEISEI